MGHTLEGGGNLCPSPVVSTHICSYDEGTKSAALRAVETNLGTIVLIAIGDRAEPTKASVPTIALPETAIAMIESFASALDW